MNILVFEYIVGGGLAGRDLPPSLAAEGGMMLQALLDDLKSLPNLTLLVPVDRRYAALSAPANAETVIIGDDREMADWLPELIARSDAVWPIAPESEDLLADIATWVLAQDRILLSSAPDTIRLCGDKFATYRSLSDWSIAVAETWRLSDCPEPGFSRRVIKPADGVGCVGGMIADGSGDFLKAVAGLENPHRYVVQPFYEGLPISLSCLFDKGKGWLICCNEQQIDIVDDRFVLKGCVVNAENPLRDDYRRLVGRIAEALPGLWGYIGIDLIETPDQGPLVLEINPRLTTSYVGIKRATGINVAEQVLRLLQSVPDIQYGNHRTVEVAIQ